MRRLNAVIATTHVDLQGERLPMEALTALVDTVSSGYIPIWIEHDPRIAPVGRIAEAAVRKREDGEFEVTAVLEVFDESDAQDFSADPRELVRWSHSNGGLTFAYDWTHQRPEDKADIEAVSQIFGTRARYQAKKAAEPISLLIVAGSFVLGGIAAGFLKEIGSDGWKLVKDRIFALLSRERRVTEERLLSFQVDLQIGGSAVEVEIIHTNPSREDIGEFIERGLTELDALLPFYLKNAQDIRRLVFEAKGKDLKLKFAVRTDCRALVPKSAEQGGARSERPGG
jgi:hypothetical protein